MHSLEDVNWLESPQWSYGEQRAHTLQNVTAHRSVWRNWLVSPRVVWWEMLKVNRRRVETGRMVGHGYVRGMRVTTAKFGGLHIAKSWMDILSSLINSYVSFWQVDRVYTVSHKKKYNSEDHRSCEMIDFSLNSCSPACSYAPRYTWQHLV